MKFQKSLFVGIFFCKLLSTFEVFNFKNQIIWQI